MVCSFIFFKGTNREKTAGECYMYANSSYFYISSKGKYFTKHETDPN